MGRPIHSFLLTSANEAALLALTTKGHHAVRRVTRGRVLLRLAQSLSGYAVAAELALCVQTVYQIRQRYAQGAGGRPGRARRVLTGGCGRS